MSYFLPLKLVCLRSEVDLDLKRKICGVIVVASRQLSFEFLGFLELEDLLILQEEL